MTKRLNLYIILIVILAICAVVYFVVEQDKVVVEEITQDVYDSYNKYGITDEDTAYAQLEEIFKDVDVETIELPEQPFNMFELNDADAIATVKSLIETCDEIRLLYKLEDKETKETSYHIDFVSTDGLGVLISYSKDGRVNKVIAYAEYLLSIDNDEVLTKTITKR